MPCADYVPPARPAPACQPPPALGAIAYLRVASAQTCHVSVRYSPGKASVRTARSGWLERVRPRALRTRLAAAAAVSILAAVVVFAVVTVALVDHQLRSSLDAALRERAQEVAQLAVSAPGVLSDPGALESPISGRQISVEVLDAHERIVARSLNLGAELLPEGALARAAVVDGRTGAETIKLNGRPMRVYAAPIADAGGPAAGGAALVASDTSDIAAPTPAPCARPAGGAVLVASDTSDIARTPSRLGVLVALSGAAVVLVAALA